MYYYIAGSNPLTHDGGDGQADAHLSLKPSDNVLRLHPLARHQHLQQFVVELDRDVTLLGYVIVLHNNTVLIQY